MRFFKRRLFNLILKAPILVAPMTHKLLNTMILSSACTFRVQKFYINKQLCTINVSKMLVAPWPWVTNALVFGKFTLLVTLMFRNTTVLLVIVFFIGASLNISAEIKLSVIVYHSADLNLYSNY